MGVTSRALKSFYSDFRYFPGYRYNRHRRLDFWSERKPQEIFCTESTLGLPNSVHKKADVKEVLFKVYMNHKYGKLPLQQVKFIFNLAGIITIGGMHRT